MSTAPLVQHHDLVDLPEILKARRSALNMSRDDLARASGVSVRQIARYEAGEQEPSLGVAIALADALDMSITELAGRERHELELGGDWWAAWQTFKDGQERVDVHRLQVRQQSDYLQLHGERTRPIEEGAYAWRGEARLFDNDTLIGWYRSIDAAVRSKGALYMRLHSHGLKAEGRWVGLSYDGNFVVGIGVIARSKDEAEATMHQLAGGHHG